MTAQINLGPFTFHLYGLIIGLAIFTGWYLAKKRAHLYKIQPKIFEDSILLVPLILALVGARIYHVLDYWNYYKDNFVSTLFIFNGGIGIWGALIGAFLGFAIISKIKKIKLLTILDLSAPSFLLAQSIGRIGNYFNQEGFGPPTSMPWGVYINQLNRPERFQSFSYFHPTFFYEAILDFIFFLFLIIISKKLKVSGQTFAIYLILYSLGRIFAEHFRIDTWQIANFKVAYFLSSGTLLFGIVFLFFLKKNNKKT